MLLVPMDTQGISAGQVSADWCTWILEPKEVQSLPLIGSPWQF